MGELRRIHQERLSVRHSYGRGGEDRIVGDSSNRPPGLVSLQRFMKRGRQSSVESKSYVNRESKGKENFANFDGHGNEFRDNVANPQNFSASNDDGNSATDHMTYEENGTSNSRNRVVFTEAMSDGS